MRQRSPLMVVFLTVLMDLIGFGLIVPLLTRYAEDFGANGLMLGILFLSYAGMQMVFSPFWGRLSDRIGRRPVLLCSIAGNFFALLVAGLAPGYGWLLVARLLSGIFTSNIPVASAYVADVTAPEERARGMGLLGAARGIGFVIGPVIGGELSVYGMAVPFFGAAVLCAINFVAAFFLLPESLPLDERTVRQGQSFRRRWMILKESEGASFLVAVGFIQVTAFSMLEMSFVLFLERRLNLLPEDTALYAGRVFTFIGVILAGIQGGALGALVRRWGERLLLNTGLLTVSFGMLAFPLIPEGSWSVLLLLTGIVAVGQALVNPNLSSMLSRSVAADQQGVVLGSYHSVLASARVVGPVAAGLLFDWGGENTPYWVGGLLMFVAWVAAVVLLTSRQRVPT